MVVYDGKYMWNKQVSSTIELCTSDLNFEIFNS